MIKFDKRNIDKSSQLKVQAIKRLKDSIKKQNKVSTIQSLKGTKSYRFGAEKQNENNSFIHKHRKDLCVMLIAM